MLQGKLHLDAYFWATAPLRSWLLRRLRNRRQSPVTGIFLHRIGDDVPSPWSMTTSEFATMLDWLEQNVDLVSIEEAQKRIQFGNSGRIAVHLSFDDGYADNCLFAVPELLRRQIPFTYYVTTYNIKHGKPFPHDLERGQPLAPNSIDEIRAMADAGVEIGAHTRTHAAIGVGAHMSDVEFEIRGSRDDIADWLGKPPDHFAFPYGQHEHMSPRAIQYAYDLGFHSYSSAYGGFNRPLCDHGFHVKRFHGDPNFARLRNWVSGDPRWLYGREEFEYVPFERERTDAFQPTATSS